MGKENVVPIYNEYHPAVNQKEILPFTTMWTDLEGIMVSEVSQKEKDKYCGTSLLGVGVGRNPNS